jgi:hypothetical protein
VTENMAWAKGYDAVKPIGDGKWLALIPLLFGRKRIAVCTPEATGEHW